MDSLFRVCRINAWLLWNQSVNIKEHKILMSPCAAVSKFGSSVSCKQSKFQQKIHSKWKMWMLNLEQKISMILLCLPLTGIFLYWSCKLRANIDRTIKLTWQFNYTHILAGLRFSRNIHSKWKMWILNLKGLGRNAYNMSAICIVF